MRKFSFVVIIIILFINLSLFSKQIKVTIFHINDLHSHIKNLAKISAIVNKARAKNKNVFFVNAGDNFSGNPVVDQYEPKGEPLFTMFKLLKFDVLTLGNHEFDYGKKILRRFIFRSDFKTVSANIIDKNKWLASTKPYIILKTREGLKLAVLGIIQVEKETGIPATHPKNLTGMVFKDELETIGKYEFLKDESDAMIILSHMGIETDIKAADKYGWIDLIIGGHSHTIIENPKKYNSVLITQAGAMGRFLGKIELIFENNRLVSKRGLLINLSNVNTENETVRRLIDEYNNNETLNKVVAYLPFALRGKRELGNFICDAMNKKLNSDFSFMNTGGIRVNRLGKKVTVKNIYTMHPFNNDIVVFHLTPNEIRSLITTSFNKGENIDLYCSGLSYKIYKSLNKGQGIKKIELRDKNGRLLNESKHYSVAINNYIATAYKFTKKDTGRSQGITLAETVTEYLKSNKKYPDYKRIRRAKVGLYIDDNAKAIAITDFTISNKGVWNGSCSMGNLVADGMVSELGVDIAFYPSRNLKKDLKIKKGKKIFAEMIPFLYKYSDKNKIITGKMSGKDISKFIYKINRYRNRTELQVSGIKYKMMKDSNGRVSFVNCSINNKKIDDKKKYKVAFVDYDFKKFYKIKRRVKNTKTSEKTVAEILIDYIKKTGKILKKITEKRIEIIGEK